MELHGLGAAYTGPRTPGCEGTLGEDVEADGDALGEAHPATPTNDRRVVPTSHQRPLLTRPLNHQLAWASVGDRALVIGHTPALR